jgi:hypothetical protein
MADLREAIANGRITAFADAFRRNYGPPKGE